MSDKPASQHLFSDVLERVQAICATLAAEGQWPAGIDFSRVVVEPPRDASHGDMATNAAMVLAKDAKAKPRELADKIAEKLRADDLVASVEVAGPGFINLTLKPQVWAGELLTMLREGASYGKSAVGHSAKVNVEYVSANPTGPMHVGHCRGAVFGDALCGLLDFAGYDVTREYYINDAGAQVDVLARSAFLRYREALGENIGEIPEGLYPGDYLVPVGQALAAEHGDKLKAMSESAWLPIVRAKSIAMMMDMIRGDLAALNIKHEVFFSERSLIETGNNKVTETIDFLRAKGDIYEGRLPPPKGKPVEDYEDRIQTLFRATAYGDDVDRPLIKSDGSYTYFASDIAYHKNKIDRGFLDMINVFGADHGGYIKRMQAAVKAVSGGKAALDVKVVQLVRLLRDGEQVRMSKRSGRVRHAARSGRRGRLGCRAIHDAVPQERRRARFRPRQGARTIEGQRGVLRPVRTCPRPFDLQECPRGGSRPPRGRCRPVGLAGGCPGGAVDRPGGTRPFEAAGALSPDS